MTVIERRLQYDNRVALQQADQAIRKDVIRALVELITNSNDSYHRLEDAKQSADGMIVIEIQRRHKDSVLRIRDFAEGMNGDQLDQSVGTYGAATSGFLEGRSVRGLWGRGLKDAFFGLGHGHVFSFRDGMLNRCSLMISNNIPMYKREQPVRATRVLRKQYGMSSENGTVMEIVVSRDDVRVPQFDHMRRMLERHFELRAIMTNQRRRVLLRDLDGHGKTKQEVELSYKEPTGEKVLDESFVVPGYPAESRVEIYRSDVPLTSPAEDGDIAEGGLLIISKHVVLGLTLFKYESNEYASHFYGRVTCDYIHDLLKKEPPEPVLTATRDGIEWKHPFAKVLKLAVETRMEPLVDAERRRAQAEERSAISKKLRARLDQALKELNEIANLELGKLTNGPTKGDGPNGKLPFMPPSGFGFVPVYAHIQAAKPAALTLRAMISGDIPSGSLVTVESDNPEVLILTSTVVIEEREDFPGIGQARVEIEGRQVGAESIITARLNELKAEAIVKVVSKKETTQTDKEKKGSGGMFRDVKFDPIAEPKQRVRFDRETSNIIIATKAPSVEAYLDTAGEGHDTPQGQVLLAELVTEAVCREIARNGVERGTFLAPAGAETDAIQREYIRLQNQYAHLIHSCFVDAQHRRVKECPQKKGRPTREETLSKAVSEV